MKQSNPCAIRTSGLGFAGFLINTDHLRLQVSLCYMLSLQETNAPAFGQVQLIIIRNKAIYSTSLCALLALFNIFRNFSAREKVCTCWHITPSAHIWLWLNTIWITQVTRNQLASHHQLPPWGALTGSLDWNRARA